MLAAAKLDAIAKAVRTQIGDQRAEYEQYHQRHATAGTAPLDDWAKVVLAPGLGMITAARDKRSAATANLCYRAVLESMAAADAIGGFQFIAESDVFEFEHWQLERRKIDEQDARDRATLLLPRHVAVVIGAGSGIGRGRGPAFRPRRGARRRSRISIVRRQSRWRRKSTKSGPWSRDSRIDGGCQERRQPGDR